MPFYWTIDSRKRLFTGFGEGAVSFGDVLALLEALVGAHALSYRKLFDTRAAQPAMTDEEMLVVCAEIRSHHARSPIGALAIVATAEQTLHCARLLGVLAAADRPMKMFSSPPAARLWLSTQKRPKGARPGRMAPKGAGPGRMARKRRPNLRPGRR
jgi:hypothetical protein